MHKIYYGSGQHVALGCGVDFEVLSCLSDMLLSCCLKLKCSLKGKRIRCVYTFMSVLGPDQARPQTSGAPSTRQKDRSLHMHSPNRADGVKTTSYVLLCKDCMHDECTCAAGSFRRRCNDDPSAPVPWSLCFGFGLELVPLFHHQSNSRT
jgi:hypothetical protein